LSRIGANRVRAVLLGYDGCSGPTPAFGPFRKSVAIELADRVSLFPVPHGLSTRLWLTETFRVPSIQTWKKV